LYPPTIEVVDFQPHIEKEKTMKAHVVLAACLLALNLTAVTDARAQVVLNDDQEQSYTSNSASDERRFLHRWNQRHEVNGEWEDNFGPRDAIRLLERRGYEVRSVDDVGPRFLVHARRDDDNLLVSVSRQGEIMGVVHEHD
jgi:hypothetical protein